MPYQNNQPNPAIGALWIKQSKKGTQYMSGNIEIDGKKIAIVCFANKKTKDNQPDYRILPSEDRPPRQQREQEYNQQALSEQGQAPEADEIQVSDIPF